MPLYRIFDGDGVSLKAFDGSHESMLLNVPEDGSFVEISHEGEMSPQLTPPPEPQLDLFAG